MKKPTIRQMKYAHGLMNENKTRRQIAIDAGFSANTARVPKSIENKKGFKLAVAFLAGEAGNTAMKLMYELQARDLKKIDNKTLILYLDVLAKNVERFNSKLYSTKGDDPFLYGGG